MTSGVFSVSATSLEPPFINIYALSSLYVAAHRRQIRTGNYPRNFPELLDGFIFPPPESSRGGRAVLPAPRMSSELVIKLGEGGDEEEDSISSIPSCPLRRRGQRCGCHVALSIHSCDLDFTIPGIRFAARKGDGQRREFQGESL